MADELYTNGKLEVFTNGIFPTGTEDYELLLLDAATPYSFNPAHQYVSDVAAFEIDAGIDGYERKALTGLAVSVSGTSVGLHGDMVTYTDIGEDIPPWQMIPAGIIYRLVTDDSDSWLLGCFDSITATTNGDDLIVSWATTGIVRVP